MPRRDFQNHLRDAQDGLLPDNVLSLGPGQDDGTFTITYQFQDSHQIQIQAQASDVGDYPRSHSFFIYTDSNDVPRTISSAIQDISILSELTISQAIREVAAKLDYATAVKLASESAAENSDADEDMEEDFSDPADLDDGFCPLDDQDLQDEGYETFTTNSKISIPSRKQSFQGLEVNSEQRAKLAQIVREDLRAVKKAGFRVSHHGDILSPGEQCYVMISIRVAKLGIPDDTLQAWHLHRTEYIMLILKYSHGYRTLQVLKDSKIAQKYLTMHLLVTKAHKLSLLELSAAIDSTKKADEEDQSLEQLNHTDQTSRTLFIGSALNELLNSRLLTLLSYRLNNSINWTGAVHFYNDRQGTFGANAMDTTPYQVMEDVSRIENLPDSVLADHVQDVLSGVGTNLSVPCAAMQFTLRHIVRCTEFCLVCFGDTQDDFEALKPYVCSKPLCLYQYMSMGLGPGIEFEVLSQQYVVDLLVSFCYSGAANYGLRELPLGLGFMVPDPNLLPGLPQISPASEAAFVRTPNRGGPKVATTGFDPSAVPTIPSRKVVVQGKWIGRVKELILPTTYNIEHDPSLPERTFQVGDWLAFWSPERNLYHCKIIEVFHPVYRYQHAIRSRAEEALDERWFTGTSSKDQKRKETSMMETGSIDVRIVPYGKLFDALGARSKQVALRAMLDTLPGVAEMAEYLRTSRGPRGQLINWKEQIVPAALSVLRWIIASNRSCLVYTGDNPSEEMIYGMPEFKQFRFASGAPDKESRFLKKVNEKYAALSKGQPTIFAWHGSSLKNWHSIIREGLNFNEVVNGRAYGDGVYHSLSAMISIAYAAPVAKHTQWPSSTLDIQQAISLNEIVNAPKEFKRTEPYLVIQHLDWIQTRYLFVKCGKTSESDITQEDRRPLSILAQDSVYSPKGAMNVPLVIPLCAISKSRQRAMALANESPATATWSSELLGGSEVQPIYVSDDSEAEDLFMLHDSSTTSDSSVNKASEIEKSILKPSNLTDFTPGSLNRSTLPMLEAPTYATSSSSKALQREIRSMLAEQENIPNHESGWYLDPEHIDNPYQWIVELHSFENSLPLAQDMQSRKIESIVLEIRFGPNFNFSPPFVRVIRPRFLPFQQGGGGHVTAGGALCMELLTSDGWNPSSTMSAVLLQVRMAMTSLDPRPARLDKGTRVSEYAVGEAIEAYRRACIMHGWKIPDDFQKMTTMIVAPTEPKEDHDQNVRGSIDAAWLEPRNFMTNLTHKKQRRQ